RQGAGPGGRARRVEPKARTTCGGAVDRDRAGSRLKRFLPPQLAEMVTAAGNEDLLASHRREVAVVFCDLRGFTAFAESAAPEQVMEVLRELRWARSSTGSRGRWNV